MSIPPTRLGDISEVCLGAPHQDKPSSISIPVRVINVGDFGPDGLKMTSQETLQLLPARQKKFEILNHDVLLATKGTIFKTVIFKERKDSVAVLGPNLARIRMKNSNLAILLAAAITCDQSSLSIKFHNRRRVRAGGFIGKEDIEEFLFRIPDDIALDELITLVKGAQEESEILTTIMSNRRKIVDDLIYQLMLKQACL